MPSIKLKRTITELGICDTFNSKISPYFDPDFIINNRLPANEPLIEINYHDVDVAILLPDLDDSFVIKFIIYLFISPNTVQMK